MIPVGHTHVVPVEYGGKYPQRDRHAGELNVSLKRLENYLLQAMYALGANADFAIVLDRCGDVTSGVAAIDERRTVESGTEFLELYKRQYVGNNYNGGVGLNR
jgi:hypothetical protein